MLRTTYWKIVNIVAIALVTGMLFTWWAGALAFALGAIVLYLKDSASQRAFMCQTSAELKKPEDSYDKEDEWYYYHYRLHHGDKD